MAWISEHLEIIGALSGIGTLLVWVIYLQVFIGSYLKQIRATLLITRGAGNGIDAQCFLSNMSAGPVYVQSVIVSVETARETIVCPVTDRQDLDAQSTSDPRRRTRQGPLGTGEIAGIGSFRALINHALGERDASVDTVSVKAVVIEVLGVYGSADLPIGARRRFLVLQTGKKAAKIEGETLGTSQIRRRSERKRLIAELDRDR